MFGKKGSLIVALSTMFAGLKGSAIKPKSLHVPRMGNQPSFGRGGNTKRVNKSNVHDQKWDFRRRAGKGCGYFVNRTTGEERRFKIANPVSTKNKPVRCLSVAAQHHFGLECY